MFTKRQEALHDRSRWPRGLLLLLLFSSAAAPAGRSSRPQVQDAPDQVEGLHALLSQHPEMDVGIRQHYADLLVSRGRLDDAFEEYLTVVRVEPMGRGKDALLRATFIAVELAQHEPGAGLWTERSQAAADRYARYWPGDPMSPILLEDTEYDHLVVTRSGR